jgi:DNA topoisomerase 2-associated protein PAT1
LVQFFSVGKAKKVFPRVMRQLSNERALAVLTILLSRLGEIDVVRNSDQQLETELFVDYCVMPLVTVARALPLRIVNALLRVLLERNNLLSIAKSKAGLAILTLLMVRAEATKSQPQLDASPTETELKNDMRTWNELYDYIFVSLTGQLSSLFMSNGRRTPEENAKEDSIAWQFLAAMAVGATTVEQQRSLVLDVR